MYGNLDISVSGMIAQRVRLDSISANIAVSSSPVDLKGDLDAFRRRMALFAPDEMGDGTIGGVRVTDIALDQSEFRPVYDPNHPLAADAQDASNGFQEGYVYYPSIDPVVEQVNALDAQRAYEANIAAAEATKTMMAQALQLIA
ncbi:MAG: flagellar basal body rod protein FlgC [Planctomycetota bacterium]|jgi:flagellar basal-body rod protein FlgC